MGILLWIALSLVAIFVIVAGVFIFLLKRVENILRTLDYNFAGKNFKLDTVTKVPFLPGTPLYIVTDDEAVYKLLAEPVHTKKRSLIHAGLRMFSTVDGILFMDGGAEHASRHRILAPVLTQLTKKKYPERLHAFAAERLAAVRFLPELYYDLHQIGNEMLLSILLELPYGQSDSTVGPSLTELASMMTRHDSNHRNHGELRAARDRSIQIAKQLRSAGLLSSFSALSDAALGEDLLHLSGAHKAILSMLMFGLIELARNPRIREAVKQELAALPENFGPKDLDSLQVAHHVWLETLRVYPISNSIFRAVGPTTSITTKDGTVLQPGSQIAVPLLTLFRSTEKWGPDAQEFRPERWAERLSSSSSSSSAAAASTTDANISDAATHADAELQRLKKDFFPFLHGARDCLGKHLARLEFFILLFHVLRRAPELPMTVDGVKLSEHPDQILRWKPHPYPHPASKVTLQFD